MDNWSYHTGDVKRVCENKLKIDFKKGGKEFNGWYTLDGKKVARITVPKGRKDIPLGTYSAMARQLKLHHSDLDRLLACPLTKTQYDDLIRN